MDARGFTATHALTAKKKAPKTFEAEAMLHCHLPTERMGSLATCDQYADFALSRTIPADARQDRLDIGPPRCGS
jgi:hypothetical protein